jgi:hypothetical protein
MSDSGVWVEKEEVHRYSRMWTSLALSVKDERARRGRNALFVVRIADDLKKLGGNPIVWVTMLEQAKGQ